MRSTEKTTFQKEIFNHTGEFKLSKEMAELLDTILVVVAANKNLTIPQINLQLRKCGFFISIPETNKIIEKLTKEGLLSKDQWHE